jgi:uncharacterized phage infection (PIP) family protein YhgE
MTEPEQDASGLAEAKAQFLEAEKRLRELAQGAVELTRASVMLKKARMGLADGAEALRDLSARLSDYIEALAELTAQVSTSRQRPGADDGMRAPFDQIEQRIAELGQIITQSTAENRAQIEGKSALQDADVAELKALPETMAARLAALDEVAAKLEATARSEKLQTIETIASRFDALEERIAALAAVAKEEPLDDTFRSSIGLVPEIVSSLDRLKARIDAADLQGAATRLASLESGMTDLARQLQHGRSESTGKLDFSRNLENLEIRLSEIVERTSISADVEAVTQRLQTIEVSLERLTSGLEKTLRRVRGRTADSGQLEIPPDFEESLIALAQEVHAREVTNVDMLAELRRSVGREISRTRRNLLEVVVEESGELRQAIQRQTRLLWIVALAAAGGLALALLQLV